MIVVLFMLVAGASIAIAVMVAIAYVQRGHDPSQIRTSDGPERERIAASILFHVLTAGGMTRDDALRAIRKRAGMAASITTGIDIPNWADTYTRFSTREQRADLLELAVQLVATRERAIPVHQYAALLDLSFGLGFQTDALARLREVYGFDYIDHAKDARPQDADRGAGSLPLFVRDARDAGELLRVLGIEGATTRPAIISAYRRLAAQHHPDKVFGQPESVQAAAAARFIEITRAYEALLAIYRQ